jgi:hypothetical protein
MRERINQAVKDAMKAGEKRRVATLRLITAAIKDRDVAIKPEDVQRTGESRIGDAEVLALLQKMVKQRRDSIDAFKKGGRDDLVEQEQTEIAIIEEFLPKQMAEAEMKRVVEAAVKELNASGLKDMGRTMSVLKERYTGQMDFGRASGLLKDLLK